MATQVYTQLAAQWDAVIGTGITGTISQAIAAGAGVMATMGMLWVIIFGAAMMTGQISFAVGTRRILQMVSVATLLTVQYFGEYIQTPLMDSIPAWITASTGGANGQQLPQQFDQIRNQVGQHEAAILQQLDSWNPASLGVRLECGLITMMIFVELTIVFIIYEISRGMMGLLVVSAALMLWLYIFDALRPIIMNLAGSAIAILLLQLLLSVLTAMNVAADNSFLQQVQMGGDADVQLDGMMQIFTFFLFGCVMAVLMPELAARIGNGVVPNVVPMIKNLRKPKTA